ncbi:hypothetical protein [Cellulomonas alba]|uniref:Lipoprotein LpqB beta-propeller domain-containing protein n=1 Tax=Cellulomonas alba TaxID=3053467 RepID=A0ABT7SFW3_9CELL|nr:hypothetical protein [Cellulomonas alba]MDM7855016.1 hypothetical protein [Cellulomonas alba]
MTRDLDDLMAAALAARERTLPGLPEDATAWTATVARVRRRRRARHTATTVSALAVAGLVAGAGWLGVTAKEHPAPAVPPPSVTSTPTSAPAVPTPASPTVGAVLTSPGVPDARPLDAAVLAGTGPGWVVATYWPARDGSDGPVPATPAVLVVSPTGERYRAHALPPGIVPRVLSWRSGAAQVRVEVVPTDPRVAASLPGATTTGTLDLLTGALTTDQVNPPDGATYVATTPAGVELWSDGTALRAFPPSGAPRDLGATAASTAFLVSPDGSLVAQTTDDATGVYLFHVDGGPRTEVRTGVTDGACQAVAWHDATSLLVSCFDFTGGGGVLDWNPRLELVTTSGDTTPLGRLRAGAPFPVRPFGTYVSDGVVATAGAALSPAVATADACATGAYLLQGSAATLLQGAGSRHDTFFRLAAVGGTVYVESSHDCAAADAPAVLTAHRVGTGASVVLAPAPAADGGARWVAGLASWVVGGAVG